MFFLGFANKFSEKHFHLSSLFALPSKLSNNLTNPFADHPTKIH